MNRRKFLNYIGCGCSSLMLGACSKAPITDRRQLKIIPESKLNAQAAQIFEKVKEKEKMSDDIKTLNEIKDIGKRMEDSISEYFYRANLNDPTINFDWEYILIDNKKVKNAWCMPGGKIAVYTGILDVTKNTNGLASVMGHEIAHAVARHSAERASQSILMDAGTYALEKFILGSNMTGYTRDLYSQLRQVGLELPFSRNQESEADYLGLIFMSLAGYNIEESYKIWERMMDANDGKTKAEFWSTHPSSDNRIKKLKEWIPIVSNNYPAI